MKGFELSRCPRAQAVLSRSSVTKGLSAKIAVSDSVIAGRGHESSDGLVG